MNTMPIST